MYCLGVPSTSGQCLALTGPTGSKPTPVIEIANLAVAATDPRVAGVLTAGDDSFELVDFRFEVGGRATIISALTVGSEPADQGGEAQLERTVAWVGGIAGKIYKLGRLTSERFSVAEFRRRPTHRSASSFF